MGLTQSFTSAPRTTSESFGIRYTTSERGGFLFCVARLTNMKIGSDTNGGIIVSSPAYAAYGLVLGALVIRKNRTNLNAEPITIDATAPDAVDFFQNVPKTNGTRQPAKTISNASIK